jgi:hypothetical protein
LGCYAYGANGQPNEPLYAPSSLTGLHISCNAFNYDTTAIDIETSATGQGISIFQGFNDTSAGNTFYPTGSILNNGYNIRYYYDPNISYTLPTVNSSVLLSTAALTSCPSGGGINSYANSSASPVMLSSSDLAAYKSAFVNSQNTLTDSLAVYNNLIDFGNTDSVLAVIASARLASELNFIVSHSPWLSAQVVYAVVTDALISPHMDTNLLTRNPQAVRDMELSPVYSAYFPGGAYTDTFLHITGIGRRYVLESSLLQASAQMSDYSNSILTAMKVAVDTGVSLNDTTGLGLCTDTTNVYYGLDSNAAFIDLDSIPAWLANTGGLWAQYATAGYYNYIGDAGDLSSLMTSIGSSGVSGLWPDYDSDDYNNYNTILGLLAEVTSDGRLIDSLTSGEITTLNGIGMPPSPLNTPNISWNILGPPKPVHPDPCLVINLHKQSPNNNSSNGRATPASDNTSFSPGESRGGASLYAYPNPAKDNIIFTYNLPNSPPYFQGGVPAAGGGGGNCKIVITDIIGNVMQTLPITTSGSGTVVWDTHNIISGVYLYKLVGTSATPAGATGKIVIEK